MLFNSYTFLFFFLPLVLLAYYYTPARQRNGVLALAGYLFYGYWDWRFCSLLFVSTLWDYLLGRLIYHSADRRRKRALLMLSVVLNLGLLGYFKYADFFIASLLRIFPDLPLRPLGIVLPIGISFFTFQSMSYSIDLYRGKARPVASFVDFACYIAMFPQLIAGPIVRYRVVAAQLVTRFSSPQRCARGLRRFIFGLAKKVLVADTLASLADAVLVEPQHMLAVWIGIVAFSLQIYYDFSGYSDMAIGLGEIFGFTFPENFRAPYRARGIADFWRRWHITLSEWLRDYLYIPLGGSRCAPLRCACNMAVTMVLCGLWHGAQWTYVLWGGYYGVLLIVERPFRERLKRVPPWLVIPATYALVLLGWVLFRAASVPQAVEWYGLLLGAVGRSGGGTMPVVPAQLLFLLAAQLGCWRKPLDRPLWQRSGLHWDVGMAGLFLACVVVMLGSEESPFLYYQF